MPKRIKHLTDEQRAAIPNHVAKWIQVGWCTDEADWAQFEDGCERCYGYSWKRSWIGTTVSYSGFLCWG